MMDRPDNEDTAEERKVKEKEVTQSMLEYLSSTGSFQNWDDALEEMADATALAF
jgi:hypothetical protein